MPRWPSGFSVIWGVMNLINLAMGAWSSWRLYHILPERCHGSRSVPHHPHQRRLLFIFGYLVQKYLISHVIEASVFMTLILTFGLDMF